MGSKSLHTFFLGCKRTQAQFLVQRGVIFAIAHVRGGGDLGQYWYLDGKMGNKLNTFEDTIAAATHLIQVCRCTLLHAFCAPCRQVPWGSRSQEEWVKQA